MLRRSGEERRIRHYHLRNALKQGILFHQEKTGGHVHRHMDPPAFLFLMQDVHSVAVVIVLIMMLDNDIMRSAFNDGCR